MNGYITIPICDTVVVSLRRAEQQRRIISSLVEKGRWRLHATLVEARLIVSLLELSKSIQLTKYNPLNFWNKTCDQSILRVSPGNAHRESLGSRAPSRLFPRDRRVSLSSLRRRSASNLSHVRNSSAADRFICDLDLKYLRVKRHTEARSGLIRSLSCFSRGPGNLGDQADEVYDGT